MHNSKDKITLGFWLYLMTDLLMFAVLFATYSVLRTNTYGGISISEIFDPPFVLVETLILLTSSFTSGMGILAATKLDKGKTILWYSLTFLLGVIFLTMELYEFSNLVHEGYSWQRSAFLSSFFTLLGAHGLHIAAGLMWLGILLIHIIYRGVTDLNLGKLKLLTTFWHFLDIVWIFIFTMVYLLGGIMK